MDSFLTWEYIATFVGMVFATSMVVEFIKEIKGIKNIQTKYLTVIVAFILIMIVNIALKTFKLINLPLMLLNSILIGFTSTGQYDFHYRKVKVIEDNKESDIDAK
ncbi:hypothetical protein [Clostridium ihumii]|uniref:hypothetical protein n=1 Tax=Clostridium ihumii TaxID=1470356 RepID=UPI000558700A|nr:hypothetical protein [Clostridium ihumii]